MDRDRVRVGIPARAVPLFFAGRARFCATLIGKNADNAQRHGWVRDSRIYQIRTSSQGLSERV